jgi:hypothetical protein
MGDTFGENLFRFVSRNENGKRYGRTAALPFT